MLRNSITCPIRCRMCGSSRSRRPFSNWRATNSSTTTPSCRTQWGHGFKKELPAGPLIWNGNRFKKDQNGNFRFVYSGQDARAGQNCNAIILEFPLSFLTAISSEHRVVNTWGESWVLKAAHKVETI